MGEDLEGPLAEERKLVAQAKKLGLFAAGAATQKYMQAIQDQQEIMGAIADMRSRLMPWNRLFCGRRRSRRRKAKPRPLFPSR